MRNSAAAFLMVWGILCAGVPAFGAQGERADVFGAAGIGTWGGIGGNIRMGSGLSAGGSFGFRLSRRFGLEGEYDIFRMNGDRTSYSPATPPDPPTSYKVPYKADGLQISVNCLWHFGEGRVRPYLLLGGGVQTFRQEAIAPSTQLSRLGGP